MTSFSENIDRAKGPIELIEELTATIHHALDLSWVAAEMMNGTPIEHPRSVG